MDRLLSLLMISIIMIAPVKASEKETGDKRYTNVNTSRGAPKRDEQEIQPGIIDAKTWHELMVRDAQEIQLGELDATTWNEIMVAVYLPIFLQWDLRGRGIKKNS